MTKQSGRALRPIAEVRPQERVAVRGVIRRITAMALRGCPACRCALADGSGELDLIFLGRVELPGMKPGRGCSAEGTVATRDDRLVLWNPRYELEPAGDGTACDGAAAPRLAARGTPAPAGQGMLSLAEHDALDGPDALDTRDAPAARDMPDTRDALDALDALGARSLL